MLPDALIQKIIDDRVHGSTELALMAVDGVAQVVRSAAVSDISELQEQILTLINRLQNCRPSMVALSNLCERVHLSAVQLTLGNGLPGIEEGKRDYH